MVMLSVSMMAVAYDFSCDGIYYDIISEDNRTVEVTFGGSPYFGGSYSGNIVIPSEVVYNNKTYTVIAIGKDAFHNETKVRAVAIPNSVTTIDSEAFRGCTSLTSVTIPNSVTTIRSEAFSECTSLTSVTIPNSVTTIMSRTFYGCTSLTSVTIPNSVTIIGSEAFYGCRDLSSLTIGTGVILIENGAFEMEYYENIEKVIWLPNTPPEGYTEIKGLRNYVANDSYSNLENVTVYPFLSSIFEEGGIKYVPVSPSDRTCDAIDCVYDNSAANIMITKTVNHQGVNMSLLNVNDYLCYNNDSIKTVTIKDFDANISYCAFSSCDGIETVDIKNLTGNIGDDAFVNCYGIETVDIEDLTGNIGDKAFYGCRNLKGIDIPNTVTSIGIGCFESCSSLAYANIGSGIDSLPDDCFSNTALTEIRIPKTVNNIGDNVFFYCWSLANVYIEDRQTELVLGSNSNNPIFSGCPLDSVYIGGNISYDSSSSAGYSPFYRNTSLRAVKITDKETEISANEFYGCTNLQRVELGDGIENIQDYAFSGCSAIESFTFGNSLLTIGEEAFSDCTAMTQLISRTEVPPVCGTQALDDINKWNCTLLVPDKSIDAYKAADQWKEFFFIESGISDIDADDCSVWVEGGKLMFSGFNDGSLVDVYTVSGQHIYNGEMESCPDMSTGIYIIAINGSTYKILVK